MPGREESQYALSSPEARVARDPGVNQKLRPWHETNPA